MIHRSYYRYKSFKRNIIGIINEIESSENEKHNHQLFYKLFMLVDKNWHYIRKYYHSEQYMKMIISRMLNESKMTNFKKNISNEKYQYIMKKYKRILGNEVVNLVRSF